MTSHAKTLSQRNVKITSFCQFFINFNSRCSHAPWQPQYFFKVHRFRGKITSNLARSTVITATMKNYSLNRIITSLAHSIILLDDNIIFSLFSLVFFEPNIGCKSDYLFDEGYCERERNDF